MKPMVTWKQPATDVYFTVHEAVHRTHGPDDHGQYAPAMTDQIIAFVDQGLQGNQVDLARDCLDQETAERVLDVIQRLVTVALLNQCDFDDRACSRELRPVQ